MSETIGRLVTPDGATGRTTLAIAADLEAGILGYQYMVWYVDEDSHEQGGLILVRLAALLAELRDTPQFVPFGSGDSHRVTKKIRTRSG